MSAGAAAGLAGCSGDGGDGGDDGGGNDTNDSDVGEMGMGGGNESGNESDGGTQKAAGDPYPNPEGEILDKNLNIPDGSEWNPTNWNANAFADNANNPAPWQWGFNIQGSEVAVNSTNPRVALDKLEVQNKGCTVVWVMRDGDHWWDGTPVTNRDWLTHQMLQRYMSYGPNPSEETSNSPAYSGPELQIEGDKRIVFNRRRPIAPGQAELNARYRWDVKHDYYKQWLEQFEDATTAEENDAIVEDLTSHKIGMQKFAEGLGNGLWKPTDWSGIQMTLERHEGHPRYEWTNIPKATYRMVPDTQKRVEAYKSGEFDMGISANDPIKGIMGQIPDMNMVREFPYLYYRCIRFNFRDKVQGEVNHTSRRGVRRAVAYLIDQKKLQQAQTSANGYKTFPVHNHGMARGVAKTFLDEEFRSNLINYGLGARPKKAEETLKNAGYSKQKGNWVGPDGNPLKFTIQAGTTSREKVSVQFIASTLKDKGINVTPQFVSGTNFWANITESYNKLPGAIRLFGGGPYPSIPYVNWNSQVVDVPSEVAEEPSVQPVDACGTANIEEPTLKRETTPRWERPVRPEFPAEVGDPAPADETETQTLKPILWDREIEATQDIELVKERAKKLAWYQNWQVTDVPYYTESWSQAGDTVNFFWGDGSFDEDWFREPYRLWTRGIVQGRTEAHNGDPEGPLQPQR
jgi:ABC-type transport system substrate-binding protein